MDQPLTGKVTTRAGPSQQFRAAPPLLVVGEPR